MTKQEKLAKALLKPINTSAVILLGYFTIGWGLWLICPFWDVFAQALAYSSMASFMTEYAWGALAVFTGAITSYGAIKGRYCPLIAGAASASWFWSVVSLFCFFGNPADPAWLTAFIFAIYSAFVYLNIRVNRRFANRH